MFVLHILHSTHTHKHTQPKQTKQNNITNTLIVDVLFLFVI